MTAIEIRDVSAGYRSNPATLSHVHLDVSEGELCCLLGPNGAGKSTLLRCVAGLLARREGTIRILGEEVGSLDRRALARRVAFVPQAVDVALGFTVGEVVRMGRAPHQGAWMSPNEQDEQAVERALSACELLDLCHRPVGELSGGEQKRVAIARALAQEARVLLLDEPGAHLDVRHAVAVDELIRREVDERRLACIAVAHDLNAAARVADRVALLRAGRLVVHGPIEEVMTYRRLKEVFETELYVGVNELDGARYFLPVRPRSRPPGPRDL